MTKFWLVFRNEYLRHVLRKRFIFALLSMPLFVGLLVGVGILAVWADYDGRPVGYVDPSGFFKNARSVPQKSDSLFPPLIIKAYSTITDVKTALENQQIQASFVIDSHYLDNGQVEATAQGTIKDSTRQDFQSFLRYNLLAGQTDQVAERVLNGPEIVIQSLNTNRKMAGNEFINILLPLVSGLLFIVVVNTSGSYLVQALIEEKENRTCLLYTSDAADE